jgi:flagellar FliJ protein
MSPVQRWSRLKDMAARQRDASAQRLSTLVKERDAAKQKLDALIGYRKDYEARLARAKQGGISGDTLRNYQSFLAQLERAIAQQASIVDHAERNTEDAKAMWTSDRHRVDSFQTMKDRSASHEAKCERRTEQKQNDEWAVRTMPSLNDSKR